MSRGALRSYLLLLEWQFLRYRRLVPMFVLIQIVVGLGIIFGFAFLLPRITPTVALFFATGAATMTLMLIGLVAVPQEMAMARTSGRHAYFEALPVPRTAPMLAGVTFWVAMQLPGGIATLVLGMLRFHIPLHVSPLVVPATMLTALTAAAVGSAISMSVPPVATQQITQFLSIGLLLFSPINFPLSRLPLVLQDIHRALPVAYMADIMRGSLTGNYDESRLLSFGVVTAWCVLGLAMSARAAAHRR